MKRKTKPVDTEPKVFGVPCSRCGVVPVFRFCDKPVRRDLCQACNLYFRFVVAWCQRQGGKGVSNAVRAGRLAPVSECRCVDCGQSAQQYDHRDYTRPEDVAPVCIKCNNRRKHASLWPIPPLEALEVAAAKARAIGPRALAARLSKGA